MMRRSLLPLLAVSLLVTLGCSRRQPLETVRTPVWVLGGQGLVHTMAKSPWLFRSAPPRYDLWRATPTGAPLERLVTRIDSGSVHPEALNPDGHTLVCLRDAGEDTDLIIVNLLTGESALWQEDLAVVPLSLCWDPSGRRLAMTLSQLRMIAIADYPSGAIERHVAGGQVVCDWVPGDPPQLLLSTDNPEVSGNALSVWNPAGTALPHEVYRTPEGGRIHSARVNPSGSLIAVIVQGSQTAEWTLTFVDLESGQTHVAWESPRPLVGLTWSYAGDAITLSQLMRTPGTGWELYRLALADLQPTPLAQHTAGADVSPSGERVAIALTGNEQIDVLRVEPRP